MQIRRLTCETIAAEAAACIQQLRVQLVGKDGDNANAVKRLIFARRRVWFSHKALNFPGAQLQGPCPRFQPFDFSVND